MTESNLNTNAYASNWSQWLRRVTFVALAFAWLIGAIIFLPLLNATLIAAIIVYVLYFPTRFVVRRTGWSFGVSGTLVFLFFLALIVVLLLAMGIPLLGSSERFVGNLAQVVDDAVKFLQQYTPDQGWLLDNNGAQIINLNFILEPLSQIFKSGEIPQEVGELASNVATGLFGAAGSLGSFVILTIGVLTLAFYMMLELPMAFRWLGNLPPYHRRELSILLDRSAKLWSRYLYGMVVLSLIGGGATLLQLAVMGIDNAVFLSILSAFAYFIPIFGGYVAGGIVFFGALINGSSWIQLNLFLFALLTWGIYTIIQAGIISSFVAPQVFGKSANIPVTIIIVGLVIFTLHGGFMGALLGVPAMAIIREVWIYLTRKLRGGDPYPDESEPAFITSGLFSVKNIEQTTH